MRGELVRVTNGQTAVWIAGLLVILTGVSAFAQVIDRDTIDRTLDEQQRAQAQTVDLLGGVLDVQLRQLEENGLTEHETYRNVQLMRRHLQTLVETDMQRVVETLRNARQRPPDERDEAFKDARQQIRQVVRQLTVERQLLLQRLRIFELAELLRKLIEHQARAHTTTTELIGKATSTAQAARTLKLIEDQRDIKEQYQHLITTLLDLKHRRGLNAVIAADGLRVLKVLELDRFVESAPRQLQDVALGEASETQATIIKGLKELWKVIDRAQGTIDTENATAREIVRALIDHQKQLRDQAKSLTDRQSPPTELVNQQAQLQGGIARLTEHLANHAKADGYRQQAEAAVFEAASNLLENKVPQAIADQGRVLGSLAALERAITDNAPSLSRDLSADELAQSVQILSQVQTALNEAIQKLDGKQQEHASLNPAKIFRALKDLLKASGEQPDLPDFVRVALSDVADAIDVPAPDSTAALHAAHRSKMTVDRALIETRRISLAIRIGELTRSAEVLERAAAEQRSLVKETVGLMNGGRSAIIEGTNLVTELSERQSNVVAVADKVASALTSMAPASALQISDATKQARTLNDAGALAAAVGSPDGASSSIDTAVSIAQKLAETAQDLRSKILESAEELTQLSTEQAEKLSELRTVVEFAVDQLPSLDVPFQLEQARQDLDRAIQQQLRAQGRPTAADALAVASTIQEALDTQEASELSLNGNLISESPNLKATTTQAEVAEKAHAAALSLRSTLEKQTTSEREQTSLTLRSLDEAEQTAQQAAKQTLAGETTSATALREKVRAALKAALTQSHEHVARAMDATSNAPPDSQAQDAVLKSMANSQRKAVTASHELGDELAAAANAVAEASVAFSAKAANSVDLQTTALRELLRAREILTARIRHDSDAQAQLLAEQLPPGLEIANRVDAAVPSAATAIRQAVENVPQEPMIERTPQHAAAITNRVALGLEQAVAELGAREQEVRHDLAIAESVTTSIKRQQTATSTIAEQASELERLKTATHDEKPAAAERAAAHKLNDARRRFVESQRATGQAAVELSGQIEIANPPLREALEMAATFLGAEQGLNSLDAGNEMTDRPPGDRDQNSAAGQQESGSTASTDANGSQPADKAGAERRDGSATRGAPSGKNPSGLGTGFISQSPDLTAEMMAGADAIHAARQALAAQLPPSQQTDADSKSPPEYSNDTEQSESQSNESGRSSKLAKGNNAGGVNQKVKDGLIDQQPEGTEAKGQAPGESRQGDENVSSKSLKDDAWFAKLPPELRKSLRAGIGQKGPRAYEDRLKKYFQSVD